MSGALDAFRTSASSSASPGSDDEATTCSTTSADCPARMRATVDSAAIASATLSAAPPLSSTRSEEPCPLRCIDALLEVLGRDLALLRRREPVVEEREDRLDGRRT